MWCLDFAERLRCWHALRTSAAQQPLPLCVQAVNDWWWQAPMVNCSLTWQDMEVWPDPWQLLDQAGWCDLARALGMLYTLMLLDRSDIMDIDLIDSDRGNLVRVNKGIYILNWNPGEIVNIHSCCVAVRRAVNSSRFIKLTG